MKNPSVADPGVDWTQREKPLKSRLKLQETPLINDAKNDPLVRKALKFKVRPGSTGRVYSEDEVNLFVWWFCGELESSQVAHAYGCKPGHVINHAGRALKQGIADKRLGIVWRNDKVDVGGKP